MSQFRDMIDCGAAEDESLQCWCLLYQRTPIKHQAHRHKRQLQSWFSFLSTSQTLHRRTLHVPLSQLSHTQICIAVMHAGPPTYDTFSCTKAAQSQLEEDVG
jgi:hypothetical protein